ncbi:hypothetical protein GCM10010329_82980 [Streptomyces spiroverticillatus]|uniref:Secreted protein/lipoprotein n=1 Tax=Streptomyces finlayi TaxID=67296 RepID=A0A918X919_9ACTN|nr:hypothetical protein [Streptomyces finlayi]GHA47958.1 hypothetical protein GCM10010329_82980 [Streptomyces spiroverticillatus]GHD18838.1 hypothetical protein GCM10010334_82040 [Streptomyces finlayi]
MSRTAPQTNTPGPRPRMRAALTIAGTLLTLTATGCTTQAPPPDAKPTTDTQATSSTTPSPATSSADPLAAEKAAALTSYDNFLREQARAYEIVNVEATSVNKYVSGNALKQVHMDVQSLKGAGNHAEGAPKNDSKVTKISMGGKLPTATITSCLDVTPVKIIDKQGKTVPHAGSLSKYIAVTTLEKWPNGWMVLDEGPEGRACTPRA